MSSSTIFVGGLDLLWSDGTEDNVGQGQVAACLEVPQGEYVRHVDGNFGWYVDNLVFISSSGEPLGQINSTFSSENLSLSQVLQLVEMVGVSKQAWLASVIGIKIIKYSWTGSR